MRTMFAQPEGYVSLTAGPECLYLFADTDVRSIKKPPFGGFFMVGAERFELPTLSV